MLYDGRQVANFVLDVCGDIERQLEHHLTGHYSAANRHAMG